jgi:hypothetical protein
MRDRTAQRIEFGRVDRRVIEANFDGGDQSSDGGPMLLRRVYERIGLTRAVAAVFSDPRDPAKITHRLRDLLAQGIYGLCCGDEDLNDRDTLRAIALPTTELAQAKSLCSAAATGRSSNSPASRPTTPAIPTRASRAEARKRIDGRRPSTSFDRPPGSSWSWRSGSRKASQTTTRSTTWATSRACQPAVASVTVSGSWTCFEASRISNRTIPPS